MSGILPIEYYDRCAKLGNWNQRKTTLARNICFLTLTNIDKRNYYYITQNDMAIINKCSFYGNNLFWIRAAVQGEELIL